MHIALKSEHGRPIEQLLLVPVAVVEGPGGHTRLRADLSQGHLVEWLRDKLRPSAFENPRVYAGVWLCHNAPVFAALTRLQFRQRRYRRDAWAAYQNGNLSSWRISGDKPYRLHAQLTTASPFDRRCQVMIRPRFGLPVPNSQDFGQFLTKTGELDTPSSIDANMYFFSDQGLCLTANAETLDSTPSTPLLSSFFGSFPDILMPSAYKWQRTAVVWPRTSGNRAHPSPHLRRRRGIPPGTTRTWPRNPRPRWT